jgi:hypothetical protein
VSALAALPLLLLLAVPAQDPAVPGCRTVNGLTACGYGCRTDAQRPRCARTPEGRCTLLDGQAVCFDPPTFLTRVYGAALPAPECRSFEGQVACGYRCAAQAGQVRCARTPQGVCHGRSGQVVCFDPSAAVYAVWGVDTPPAECRTVGEHTVCGYRCVAGLEGVRCASTPAGVCRSEGGRVACFDPPAALLCAHGRDVPTPQCRSSEGQPVCGYGCASAYGRAACARTPQGVCRVAESQVHCFDPPVVPAADRACLALIGLAALEEPAATE